jgi:DNA transposition AAA+ family ATPase
MTTSIKGIPLKERTADDIRNTLKDKDEEIVNQFLALHKYAQEHNLGLTSLAHQTGIGSSILSQGFNGDYIGDYDAIAKRIETFFWRMEQKAMYGGLREFVETRLAKILWRVYEKTRIIRRIQIVQGPEQCGKTRAAVEYAHRNNSGRTIYVKLAGGSKSGCGDFIWSLADALNIPYSIKFREKRLRIKHALEPCDLIQIDEAHLIFSWTNQAQREFWDYIRTDIFADGDRGVVFQATNANMLKGINAFRLAARYNVGQLLGRMHNDVIEIDPAEYITEDDVALLVGRYYKPGKTTLHALHLLAQADELGHFGLLDDVMTEAWTRAKARKKDLCDDTVNAVANEVRETLKGRKELYS